MRLLLILIGAFAVMVGAALVVPRVIAPTEKNIEQATKRPDELGNFRRYRVYRADLGEFESWTEYQARATAPAPFLTTEKWSECERYAGKHGYVLTAENNEGIEFGLYSGYSHK